MESQVKFTRTAFLWARILNTPCWSLMCMLAIILYKEMHITPLQITLITALKPISALFAPYWSLPVYKRPDRLVQNIFYANIVQYVPLLLFPWISSSWLLILSFAIYMMLNRGIIPVWMEILKKNIPPIMREQTFARGSTMEYVGNAVIPIGLGLALDHYHLSWTWIFSLCAILGLSSSFFLLSIPRFKLEKIENMPPADVAIFRPLKESWTLLWQRRDFFHFQIGFMLGGGGLMVMQPAIPPLLVDVLNLSFTQMGMAIAACKSIGFVFTVPIWTSLFSRVNIYSFSGFVTLLAGLFPILLMCAPSYAILLPIAYIIYGIMQAGSELSWNLSGPVFARNEDSTLFSRTNVLTVGIRGCIFPFLGSFLFSSMGIPVVMGCSAMLCFLATYHLWDRRKLAVPT